MDLSIIIPAYNSEKYIEKCLLSCCNQDLPKEEYEIIVVDDGSTDNTKEVVMAVRKRFFNIRYLHQENAAQGAARNNGLRNATGRYVWFVDSDDWIKENCLSRIIQTLKEKELNGLVVGHATLQGDKQKVWRTFNENEVISGKELLSRNIFLISPTYTIWRKDHLIGKNLFFKERLYHEDSEICPRLYYVSDKIGFINDVFYFVFQNPDSTTRGVNPKRAFDCIKVVKALSDFTSTIPTTEGKLIEIMDNHISMTLNNSLYNSFFIDKSLKRELRKEWANNKDLFSHLRRSTILKYKIEGWLFSIFPNHSIEIYKLMQTFNNRPGGMSREHIRKTNSRNKQG